MFYSTRLNLTRLDFMGRLCLSRQPGQQYLRARPCTHLLGELTTVFVMFFGGYTFAHRSIDNICQILVLGQLHLQRDQRLSALAPRV